MNTIDIQLAELEKQKKQLIKQAEWDKKTENYNKLKEEFEGKVKCSIYKRKTSSGITVTWYKKVVRKEDGATYVPRETVSISVDHQYKKHSTSYEKIDMGHYSCKLDAIIDNTMFNHKKEMSVEQFKKLATANVSFTEAMVLLVENKEFIKIFPNGFEYELSQAIEKTSVILDVPHIFLSQNEAWLIGSSVFLNDLCLLLTKASITYVNDVLNKKLADESHSGRLLSDFGYRHRNDRSDEIYVLQKKLQTEYEKIKS